MIKAIKARYDEITVGDNSIENCSKMLQLAPYIAGLLLRDEDEPLIDWCKEKLIEFERVFNDVRNWIVDFSEKKFVVLPLTTDIEILRKR